MTIDTKPGRPCCHVEASAACAPSRAFAVDREAALHWATITAVAAFIDNRTSAMSSVIRLGLAAHECSC